MRGWAVRVAATLAVAGLGMAQAMAQAPCASRGELDARYCDEDGDLIAGHPTPKPVRLIADAILDVTARRDLVLDPRR